MRTFARPPSPLAAMRRATVRPVLAAALALAAPAALLSAPPAAAKVSTVGSTTVGLQPRNSASVLDGLYEQVGEGGWSEISQPETFANPEGNPVVHSSKVYAVYWSPVSNYYHGDWQGVIDTFLQSLGSESGTLSDVFGVDAQYTDKSNQTAADLVSFHGAYEDTSPYPAAGCTDPHPLQEVKAHKIEPLTCLTDQQVRQQLEAFVSAHGLPRGMGVVYYVLTPPGVTVCLDSGGSEGHCSDFSATKTEEEEGVFKSESYEHSFCSYHAAINPDSVPSGDANTVLYGVIPWTAGGVGDGQLAAADRTQATYCQDGGYDPSSKPTEQHQHAKELTTKEEEEFAEETKEEKEEAEAARALEGPHVQEPNQQKCPTADGYCDTGLADLIVNQIAVEQQDIVTDPLLNAWRDESLNEASDECRNFFAPVLGGSVTVGDGTGAGTLYNQLLAGHQYYLDTAFDAAALKLDYPGVYCIPGARLEPAFTAPDPVDSGEVVGFDGMESDITLNAGTAYTAGGTPQSTYATYSWNFGDGSAPVSGYAPGAPACETPWLSPCAASAFHSYQYGGTYDVTLTVKDVAGNTASVTHAITVVGPPPPAPAETSGSAGAGSGAGGSQSPAAPAAVPAPIARATIVHQHLRIAAHRGLEIRYSVNEQVAGHFEVLLSRSLARRLRIHGRRAKGLPSGTRPELVIAKAILVTTKGGRSHLRIRFPKHTARRLAHVHRLSLMLRLTVRNAALSAPATTTVLSKATLRH